MAGRNCKKPCKPVDGTEENPESTEPPAEGVVPEENPETTETPAEGVVPEETPKTTETPADDVVPEEIPETTENLAAVLYGINDLRLEARPIPEPKDDEVLLRMACVGICGSDVHYYVNGKIGSFVVDGPMIIGHEGSGVVAKLGKDVTNLEVGDRVAIEPGVPCRRCNFCKKGAYNLCRAIFFCATPPDDGNLSQYYTHAADFCHKLPSHVSLEEGALCEPLAVGVHACRRAGVTLGSTVLILGSGPIGLATLITAKAMGAKQVLITDLLDYRLELAKNVGADFTILVEEDIEEAEMVTKIHGLLGEAPDKTIECVGADATMRLAILATKSGGTAVLVGIGPDEMTVPLMDACAREVDIRGVFRYCNDYPTAVAVVSSAAVNLKQLITHNYLLEEAITAFETARTREGNPVKVMIHCSLIHD